jgi:hypothetical protein
MRPFEMWNLTLNHAWIFFLKFLSWGNKIDAGISENASIRVEVAKVLW